jgi:hypothetical protein
MKPTPKNPGAHPDRHRQPSRSLAMSKDKVPLADTFRAGDASIRRRIYGDGKIPTALFKIPTHRKSKCVSGFFFSKFGDFVSKT